MDLEQRLRFLARAYPVSWREQRADELIDTVRDLLGRDNTRLGWSLALNIVIGGWMTRLREHPPLGRWLTYRFLDVRMPPRWRPWVRRDIVGLWFPVRRALNGLLTLAVLLAMLHLPLPRGQGPSGFTPLMFVLVFCGVQAASTLLFGRRMRRLALRQHGFDANAEPIAPRAWPAFVIESRPRDVRQAWPWLVSGGAAGVLLAIPWQLILVRLAPTLGYVRPDYTDTHALPGYEWKMRAATAACAAVSLLIGAVAMLRLRRRLATRSPANRGATIATNWWTVCAVVGGSAAIWAALAIARDHTTAREPFTLVLHCLVLLIAPASLLAGLVARQVERSGGATVSFRDIGLGIVGRGAIRQHPLSRRVWIDQEDASVA